MIDPPPQDPDPFIRPTQAGGHPGSGHPGSGQPGAGQPGAGIPQAGGHPGAGYPGAGDSQVGQPSAGYPQAGQPGAGYPQVGQPSADYPQAGQPGAGYPQAGQPGAGYPQAGQPGAGYPQAGQPGAGDPGSGHPGAGDSQAGQPSAGYPSAGHAGSGFPDARQAGAGYPGAGLAGAGDPGVGQAGIGSPVVDIGSPMTPPAPVPAEPKATTPVAKAVPARPVGPPVVEIRGLKKSYGSHVALRGLDLTVRAGEVYGFLGRNGAGKSTTIRIIMGITKQSAGEIRLFGEPLTRRSTIRLRRRIGYVSQEQNFYGWMTPRTLGRFVRGFFPSWEDREYRRLLELLELPTQRKIRGFSGGMKAKLGLATALAHKPPLLVLDEPTAGLDPVARREFIEIVRSTANTDGRTTFFSSHLIDEVEAAARRVGVVNEGRAIFEGSLPALTAQVRTMRVGQGVDLGGLPGLGTRRLTILKDSEDDRGRVVTLRELDSGAFTDLEAATGVTLEPLGLEDTFIALVSRAPKLGRA